MVKEFNAQTFETEVIGGKKTWIIDFWAAWCGPCKMLAPLYEELEPEFKGKLQFGKINIDENEEAARKHEIMSIPCLVIFSNGREVDRIVGLTSKAELKRLIEHALKKT